MRYENDPRFRDYYLEDSYVLGIEETPTQVSFLLDVVLTPSHPQYLAPGPAEQHCYRPGTLMFRTVKRLEWKSRSLRKSVDASGQVDYGNIDIFEVLPDELFRLSGDWGELEIVANEATLTLT